MFSIDELKYRFREADPFLHLMQNFEWVPNDLQNDLNTLLIIIISRSLTIY